MGNKFFLILHLFVMIEGLWAQKFVYVDKLVPENYQILNISAVDSHVVWATASAYAPGRPPQDHVLKVLRTINGGESWQVFDIKQATGRYCFVIVGRGANEAWISTTDFGSGMGSGLLKTNDGGETWNHMLEHPAGGAILCFFDDKHVYSQNRGFRAYSNDGGSIWQVDTLQFKKDESIGFRSIAVTGDTVWLGTSFGRVLRCTEYGKTCTFFEHELLSGRLIIHSISFSDHLNGFLSFTLRIGQNFTKDLGKGIAVTRDGGKSWQIVDNAPFHSSLLRYSNLVLLECVQKGPNAGIWGMTSQGCISVLSKSTDLGQTWTLRSIPGKLLSVDSEPDGQLWVAVLNNPRKYIENKTLRYLRFLRGQVGVPKYTYAGHIYMAIEELHAMSLLKERRQIETITASGLPVTLIEQEQLLRDSLTFLKKQFFELDAKSKEVLTVQPLSKSIENLQSSYGALLLKLDSIFPEFQRQRADYGIAMPAELMSILSEDQALIQYFVTDTSILVTCYKKESEGIKFNEISKDFPLDQWIAQLRGSLTAFHAEPYMANSYDSLASAYTTLAQRLYEKLLAPIADSLPEHLIIVPDGALGYLPFEVLLTAPAAVPARWQDHAYLLKKHSISYAYSATMLREMTVHPHLHEPTAPFYGFAPRYDGDTTLLSALFPGADLRKDLSPLPHTGEEVFKAAKLMGGKYFTGKQASEANFRAKASEARILHLATHGQANDRAGDYCFLVFADQKDSAENEILYARDIYNLRLNADLVTLSACETGIGELQGGEGIISLARAFAYAGAKSIVTSLWSVSDAKTKDLMIDFYKNLRKGMLKDDALRQAKLDFLKRNRGQAAHPFYWAGFVGIGNMGRIK